MDGDIEDGGRGGLGRDDVDYARESSRGDGRRRFFLTLLQLKVRENEFPERAPRDFGLLIYIYIYIYDGFISDEEFVLLYNEIYS